MNHFLFDFLPVLLFFIAFKYYGIYAATWVGIISTAIQVLGYRWKRREWDKMQLTTLFIFVVFGGMTLYFHNPIFVKWKPTIIFWVFAFVLLVSQFVGAKPLMQRMLEGALNKDDKQAVKIHLPAGLGKKINLAWVLFFLCMGAVNIYIAYHFSDAAWVNFKLYGISVATILFSLAQSAVLIKYIKV